MLRISPLPLFIDSAAKQKKANFIEIGFLFIVIPKPPPWAVLIEPWGYCPKKCPC
ncbi:hypothetical protein M3908_002347 [Vibrio metschnikovii]|nr:hypothetical protein [Vibrio metschnikovii]